MEERNHDHRGELASEAMRIVADLAAPRPILYWLDFLFSLFVAYGTASLYLEGALPPGVRLLCYLVAIGGLYRISIFIHEVIHLPRGKMRGFKVAWNLLAGIPMLTPSFLYVNHLVHHRTRHYGTPGDCEYLPLAHDIGKGHAFFALQILVMPLLVVIRFALAPISFLRPSWRRWTLERASSLAIHWHADSRHRLPSTAPLGWWAALDLACSARVWVMLFAPVLGWTEWSRLPLLYSLAVGVLALNQLRTLAAHRFSSEGGRLDHEAQFLDSTNITGSWYSEYLFPIGLRYHALHHLLPSLPYHALGAAHRRLVATLPPDSPYHANLYPSLFAVLRDQYAQRSRNRSEARPKWDRWHRRSS
ncbi:MAG: fatty acid desaturase [Verrucomicrobiales bacterium]|nr:fatty acid desaturase [Verrucomicrobiales bacterium]